MSPDTNKVEKKDRTTPERARLMAKNIGLDAAALVLAITIATQPVSFPVAVIMLACGSTIGTTAVVWAIASAVSFFMAMAFGDDIVIYLEEEWERTK